MRDVAAPGQRRRSSPVAWGSVITPGSTELSIRSSAGYPQLHAQRGIAVLAVVVFHVYQFCNVHHFLYYGKVAYPVLNSLDAAVPWFFVITAFLLYQPVVEAALAGDPAPSLRRFAAHRMIRLLPAYYVAVIIVWFLRQPRLPGDWRDLIEHLTFTQVFDEKRIFYTIGPAWAISVLVFFYLVLAVLSVVVTRICSRLPDRRSRIIVLAAGPAILAVISLAWKAVALATSVPTDGSFTTWFGPMANWDNFSAGMLVALIAVALQSRSLSTLEIRALQAAGLLVIAVAFAVRTPNSWTTVYFSFICATGFGCLVAAAVMGRRRRASRGWVLVSRYLRQLGAISFGIYLWHEPVMLLLRSLGVIQQTESEFMRAVVIVVAASILVGWLSCEAIERPTRRLGHFFERNAIQRQNAA